MFHINQQRLYIYSVQFYFVPGGRNITQKSIFIILFQNKSIRTFQTNLIEYNPPTFKYRNSHNVSSFF